MLHEQNKQEGIKPMMVDPGNTEQQILEFLTTYAGTHKLSELSMRFGPSTRALLKTLSAKDKIRYHIDTDTRFSGWMLSDKIVQEGYVPSLQGTIAGKIVKYLKDGPKTRKQILDFFSEYSENTMRGRLSELSHSGQVLKRNKGYRLPVEMDDD